MNIYLEAGFRPIVCTLREQNYIPKHFDVYILMIFPYTFVKERNFYVNPLQVICKKHHLPLEPTVSISVTS